MTDEAHGDTPEEAPAPPTSTRWSEDAVAEDDAPPPPFVPGRSGPPAAATPGTEPAAGEETPEYDATTPEPEPFPFEAPVEAEEAAATRTDSAEDDFPFERFDIEGRGEEAGPQDRPERAAPAEPEVADGSSPAPAAAMAPAADTGTDAAAEAAALLDRLADMLRSEGEAGVRRELDSPDHLTAVLAGVLAGYLSGRS